MSRPDEYRVDFNREHNQQVDPEIVYRTLRQRTVQLPGVDHRHSVLDTQVPKYPAITEYQLLEDHDEGCSALTGRVGEWQYMLNPETIKIATPAFHRFAVIAAGYAVGLRGNQAYLLSPARHIDDFEPTAWPQTSGIVETPLHGTNAKSPAEDVKVFAKLAAWRPGAPRTAGDIAKWGYPIGAEGKMIITKLGSLATEQPAKPELIDPQLESALQAFLPEQHPNTKKAASIYAQAVTMLNLAGGCVESSSEPVQLPIVALDNHRRVSMRRELTGDKDSRLVYAFHNPDGSVREDSGFTLTGDRYGDAYLTHTDASAEFRLDVTDDAYAEKLHAAGIAIARYFGELASDIGAGQVLRVATPRPPKFRLGQLFGKNS